MSNYPAGVTDASFDDYTEPEPEVLTCAKGHEHDALEYEAESGCPSCVADREGTRGVCHDCGDPAPIGLYQCAPCHKHARANTDA